MSTAAGSIGAAAVLIGIVVVTELPGSSQGASSGSAVAGSTTVQRRDLVATDTESGTLSYAKPQTVFNRLTGTVTSLPTVGQVISPGQTLYRVSGNPVVLFKGTVPAYRDLTSGDTNGADILELNRNLRALGFDTGHQITLNDTWQAATTTAVERWQGSVGETETGTVTLGQIVFLPGPQRITTLDTVLGSNGGASGSSGSGTSTTGAAYTGPPPRAQFVSLTTTAATATTPTTATTATTTAPTTATSPATSTTPAKSPGACTSVGMGVQPGGAGATTAPTTTVPPPTTTTPPAPRTCSSPKSGRTPSSAAELLALLKAETEELKKSLTGSAGSSGTSARGGTASPSGATRSASTGSAGAPSGAASAGTGGSAASSTGAGASSGSAGATGGSGTAQAILQTTSNQLQVTVNLDATKQSEAVVGEAVTVQLPNSTTVGGKITAVSPVAQSASSSSSSASGSSAGSGSGSSGASSTPSSTVPVTIKVTGRQPLSGLDQAAVSVNFQQQMESNVLSVPVSALLATAGGGYALQEAAKPHRLIAVTPGLFAAGYVQISGAQVFPGLQVTDSQG